MPFRSTLIGLNHRTEQPACCKNAAAEAGANKKCGISQAEAAADAAPGGGGGGGCGGGSGTCGGL